MKKIFWLVCLLAGSAYGQEYPMVAYASVGTNTRLMKIISNPYFLHDSPYGAPHIKIWKPNTFTPDTTSFELETVLMWAVTNFNPAQKILLNGINVFQTNSRKCVVFIFKRRYIIWGEIVMRARIWSIKKVERKSISKPILDIRYQSKPLL